MYKTATLDLKYFSPFEFGIWWPLMDHNLLRGLDKLRVVIDQRIIISPVNGALGRIDNDESKSFHNPTFHGKVMAADIQFPDLAKSGKTLQWVYNQAVNIPEFGGVGVYPMWRPFAGFHVDSQQRKKGGGIATWSGFYNTETETNEYLNVKEAFA